MNFKNSKDVEIPEEGTRIFNRGDVENPSHFGVIAWKEEMQILIDPDEDSEENPYWISKDSFAGPKARIITEKEYLERG